MLIRKIGMAKAKAIEAILDALSKRDLNVVELATLGLHESVARAYARLLMDLGVIKNLAPGRGKVSVYHLVPGPTADLVRGRLNDVLQAEVVSIRSSNSVNVEDYLHTGYYSGKRAIEHANACDLHTLFFTIPPTNLISLGDDYANPQAALQQDVQRA